VEHQIITLTADIVSAHVANNDVAANQLGGLIRAVHDMLATVNQVPVDPIKAEPAVAVKNRSWLITLSALIAAGASKCSSGIFRPTTK
jgi:predicted transcriptional regulator